MRIRNINYKFVSHILGLMCVMEALVMLSTIIVAIYYHESLMPYIGTIVIGCTIGGILLLLGRGYNDESIGRREGMLTVSFTWLILSIIGMLPFLFTHSSHSIINSLFETISGFTTTGITVFGDVEHLPRTILFWRSLLQWQGGVGIVVFTLALVPIFGGSASKLYFEETTGITQDRFLPRIKDIAIRMCLVYILETVVLIILLWIGPMNLFDSICQAFTTLATGGFSTRNNSIASFHSRYVEYVLMIFMYLGGVNLTLVYFVLIGKPKEMFVNEELKWYTGFILLLGCISAIWLYHNNFYPTIESNIRHAFFNVISCSTSTGFATADVTAWKPFFWMIAILAMFVNACAGSTAGGFKMSRFAILMKNLGNEFKKITHPNLVTPVIFNKKQLSTSVVHQILAFSMVYTILVFIASTLLMIDGNGMIDSISAVVTAISNTGISIGQYASNYFSASTFDKSILCFVMIAGRLEIFTVITIFTTYFWKK